MIFSLTYFFLPKKKSKRCGRKPPIILNLKYKIWAHRPSIKGTKPLFMVIKAIIIIETKEFWSDFFKKSQTLTHDSLEIRRLVDIRRLVELLVVTVLSSVHCELFFSPMNLTKTNASSNADWSYERSVHDQNARAGLYRKGVSVVQLHCIYADLDMVSDFTLERSQKLQYKHQIGAATRRKIWRRNIRLKDLQVWRFKDSAQRGCVCPRRFVWVEEYLTGARKMVYFATIGNEIWNPGSSAILKLIPTVKMEFNWTLVGSCMVCASRLKHVTLMMMSASLSRVQRIGLNNLFCDGDRSRSMVLQCANRQVFLTTKEHSAR